MSKEKLVKELKQKYPNLHKVFNDEEIPLTDEEYEAKIEEWADHQIAGEIAKAEADAKKAAAESKLAALGLDLEDLKVLGLA